MSKEKVYIVLSHKHSLKAGSLSEWEVTEKVEFVNQLRKNHLNMSSAVGDYLNRKMLTGAKVGMSNYAGFESYIRKKYEKQMAELDASYRPADEVVPIEEYSDRDMVHDGFGGFRARTIFDPRMAV